MNGTPWMDFAKALIGVKEITGTKHNQEILQMWKDIKRSGIKDDETPWCAGFVGACLERAGIKSSRLESSRSYENFGVKLDKPAYGAIAVYSRKSSNGWGGHVGFVVGVNLDGSLRVLGGNQQDSVNVSSFRSSPTLRLIALRYPEGYTAQELQPNAGQVVPDSTKQV